MYRNTSIKGFVPCRFSHTKINWGFTIIELMIVLGIFAIILAIILPINVNRSLAQQVSSEQKIVISLLQRARTQAITNQNDSSHGLYITDGEYVLFAGDSYTTRDEDLDIVFSISEGIDVSGAEEMVFQRLIGTSASQSLTLIGATDSKIIHISENGLIE
jgi:prepilin-type N-terminal cleavage/methylation domain-containing protein